SLQRPKKTASAVNPADQIGSGSLTSYNDQRRQRQPSIQQIKSGRVHLRPTTTKEDSVSRQSSRSNRVGITYALHRPKKTASAVNPADQIRSCSHISYNDQRRQRQPSIQQIKSGRLHLLATTTKEDSVSRQSSRSNRVGFTYELQRPKKTASAVNPADQIGSGSLTSYNDQRRQRQPSIQQIKSGRDHLRATPTKEDSISRQSSRSNQVVFTYQLQRPKKTASAVNPADQIGSASLTRYNDQRRQRQPSIQQIKSGRVHLRATTTKEDSVSRQSSRSNRVGFTYVLQRPKKTASAVNPADQIGSGSLTRYTDQRRQHQPSIQQIKSGRVHISATTTKEDSVSRQSSRSNRVGFTYSLQRPKKTASAVNPADQIGSGSLTRYNDQRRQRQPSIQQIKSG